MVAECCTFLDNTPDKPTLLKLIDTLRTVTAGWYSVIFLGGGGGEGRGGEGREGREA